MSPKSLKLLVVSVGVAITARINEPSTPSLTPPMPQDASRDLRPVERSMRETIEWLLDLPDDERARMEQAISYNFTSSHPAPEWQAPNIASSVLVTIRSFSEEAVEILYDIGLRPALLNFAHGYNCGGGFEHAGGSQEEAIFRSSSAFLSLWPHRRSDDGPGVLKRHLWIGDFDDVLPRKEAFYPHTECGGIYSPHVRILRHPKTYELRDAGLLNEMPLFGLLTVAAQDLNRESYDPNLLREKIRTVLHMAATNGHDSVVLGAFGTGYFRNPPEAIADAFRELLNGEFASTFRAAIFAIPGPWGATRSAFEERFRLVSSSELSQLVKSVSV